MLLIPCPWCGPRDETEFALRRRGAHRAARRHRRADRRGVGRLPLHAQEPEGRHLEHWVHAYGCRRWFNVERDTVSYRITAVYKPGEPAAAGDRSDAVSERCMTA